MAKQTYKWTDNPTESGVAICDTDVLNDCLMHLKYEKQSGDSIPLFSTMLFDHVLTGDEAIGWALQGSLVTNIYPDAVAKVVELYAGGVEAVYRGVNCKKAVNGWYIADIAHKDAIDALYLSTGVADFYVLDSVNQQFYLPRNDWFVQGTSDPNKVNQFNEAGLPNIEGTVTYIPCGGAGSITDGAFTKNTQGNISPSLAGISWENYILGFDASRSSPIYGNSSTVQPHSSLKLVYYKVGNTVVNESLIDVGQVLSDLQLKADINLSNAVPSQAFKNTSISWGMPDYSKGINKAWDISHQAICDGWVSLRLDYTNTPQATLKYSFDNVNFFITAIFSSNSLSTAQAIYPISKGTYYKAMDGIGTKTLTFYPAKGAN